MCNHKHAHSPSVPTTRLAVGGRAFYAAVAKTWNNLPESDWRCFRGCAISSSHGNPQHFFPQGGGQIQGCKKVDDLFSRHCQNTGLHCNYWFTKHFTTFSGGGQVPSKHLICVRRRGHNGQSKPAACRLISRRHYLCPRLGATFHQKLLRQLPPHMTNRFRPVPRISSFHLTLFGVLAVILILPHLNQLFDKWMNEWLHLGYAHTHSAAAAVHI